MSGSEHAHVPAPAASEPALTPRDALSHFLDTFKFAVATLGVIAGWLVAGTDVLDWDARYVAPPSARHASVDPASTEQASRDPPSTDHAKCSLYLLFSFALWFAVATALEGLRRHAGAGRQNGVELLGLGSAPQLVLACGIGLAWWSVFDDYVEHPHFAWAPYAWLLGGAALIAWQVFRRRQSGRVRSESAELR